MKIYKIAKSGERYSGWIMPNGTLKEVPSYQHIYFIQNNTTLFGLNEKDVVNNKNPNGFEMESKIYMLAFLQGAIRFSCSDSGDMIINGLKSAIYKNIDKIHSIAKTQMAKRFYIYFYSRNGDSEYKFLESIEDLYRVANRSDKILVAQNESEMYAAWILPSGEVKGCRWLGGGGHARFVQDNLSLFNLTKEDAMKYMFDYYKAAFDKGAVRLSRHTTYLGVEGHLQNIRRYAEKVHQLSKTFGVKQIDISTPSGNYSELKPGEIYEI